MADAAHGRGGCERKLTQRDAEADSSNWLAVKPWRSKQACEHGHLFRSGGRSAWAGFNNLHDALFPHTRRCREVEAELLAVEREVVVGEEGATAEQDHSYAHPCRISAERFYLSIAD